MSQCFIYPYIENQWSPMLIILQNIFFVCVCSAENKSHTGLERDEGDLILISYCNSLSQAFTAQQHNYFFQAFIHRILCLWGSFSILFQNDLMWVQIQIPALHLTSFLLQHEEEFQKDSATPKSVNV